MKALLLAAGKATRLGSLSRSTPKCLHSIGGEVLLDRILRQLSDAGVTEFLINTHHLAPQIEQHIAQSPFRSSVTTVFEAELLGTLGTVRANATFFGDQGGWVLHADNYIQGNLRVLKEAFVRRDERLWGALLAFNVTEPSEYGVVTADERGVLTGFYEKVANPPSNLASAATFVLDRRAVELATSLPAGYTDLSRDLMPLLVGRLCVVEHSDGVVDIGTPEGLQKASQLASSHGPG